MCMMVRAAMGRRVNPTFKLFDPGMVPGLADLSDTITLNGVSKTPDFRYRAADATTSLWAAWTYGSQLDIASTGSAPTTGLKAPTLAGDQAVRINSGQVYQSSGTSVGNITTEDFVIELVFKFRSTGGMGVIAKKTGTGASEVGWLVRTTTVGTSNIADGTNTAQLNWLIGTVDAWQHVILSFDRSGNAISVVNGVVDQTTSIAGVTGSLSNSEKLTIGALTAFASKANMDIAYAAMWKGSNWLDNSSSTNLQDEARKRFLKLVGMYPKYAAGSYLTSVHSRTTKAYEDIYDAGTGVTTLFQVNQHWPRVIRRRDKNGKTLTGLLSETTATNLMLQSEDLTTTWSTSACSITSNVSPAPNGDSSADGIIASAASSNHGIFQDVTLTAAVHTYSAFLQKPGSGKQWATLFNETVANCFAYFDLVNGVVGNTGAAVLKAGIKDYGGGWYRCWITFTGTAAAHRLDILPASANGTLSYTGDGSTVDLIAWGVQVEASSLPHSYVPTTTASVTRNLDNFAFATATNVDNNQGSMSHVFLTEDYDTPGASPELVSLTDGTNANTIDSWINASDFVQMAMNSGSVLQTSNTGAVDVSDGARHSHCISWKTNDVRLFVDSKTVNGPDTVATPPASLTRINIGGYNGGFQTEGIIERVQIFKRPFMRGVG